MNNQLCSRCKNNITENNGISVKRKSGSPAILCKSCFSLLQKTKAEKGQPPPTTPPTAVAPPPSTTLPGVVILHEGRLPEKTEFGYPIPIPGFEENKVTLQPSGLIIPAKLLINGEAAPKGEWGTFMLRGDDGHLRKASLKAPAFVDPIPQVTVDKVIYQIAPPLKWYHAVIAMAPILLLFVGGPVSGIFGAFMGSLAMQVMRKDYDPLTKFLLVSLCYISAITFVFFFLLFIALLIIPQQ